MSRRTTRFTSVIYAAEENRNCEFRFFCFFEENMKKGLNIYAYKRIIQTSRKQTGGVTMSNILKVARLIRALEEEDRDIELKVEIIKMYRKMGIITEDDAIELAVEYC